MGKGGVRVGLCAGTLCLVLLGLAPSACRSAVPSVPPVEESASRALAEARRFQRERGEGWEERARLAALAAARLEPDWAAPGRFLDDLARENLTAHARLAERLAKLQEPVPTDPADRRRRAVELYLVGRLEGKAGTARFSRALALDPDFAWAHHGIGWMLFLGHGPDARALRAARAARRLARDPFDRLTFATAQVRYLLAGKEPDAAARLGHEALAEAAALPPEERTQLLISTLRAELDSSDREVVERGFWSALELLRTSPVDESVADQAVAALEEVSHRYRGGPEALDAALTARYELSRNPARARLLRKRGAGALALYLLDSAGKGLPYRLLFEQGRGDEPVEDWLSKLPRFVLGDDGLPLSPPLAHLVEAARGGDQGELGRALLAAGWFTEARALAKHLASADPEAAADIDRRATRGIALLDGIHALLDRVDEGADFAPWRTTSGGRDLDALLDALQFLFDRFGEGQFDLSASPRLRTGPFATVIHPGPRFSELDGRAGRGPVGEPVGGLAEALASIGRFGVFGTVVGGDGPDGTILKALSFEERSGEVLGHPYHGTVAWCQGVDVPSRPARHGAEIVGAALHEGFWIDIEGVRGEVDHYASLEQRFLAGEGTRGLRALEAEGPLLGVQGSRAAAERARIYAPLGEADRVRLALLAERRAAGNPGIRFEELLEVTAAHEAGHLVDRDRYLPLSQHLGAGLELLLSVGFRPLALARRLEYDAELLSLISLPDPRLALADILDGVEEENGVTEHSAAYRELLADLLEELESMRARGDADLDPERYLIHQLPRLDPATLRSAATAVARRMGY